MKNVFYFIEYLSWNVVSMPSYVERDFLYDVTYSQTPADV